jgi:hypothetical protein
MCSKKHIAISKLSKQKITTNDSVKKIKIIKCWINQKKPEKKRGKGKQNTRGKN